MDFGALCNFSGEKYHQEINIFKESEASRESAGELIRSLWVVIGPIGPYRLGYIFVTRAAKEGSIRKLKSLRNLTKQSIPIATLNDL